VHSFRNREPEKDMGKPLGSHMVGAAFKKFLHHIACTHENKAKKKDPIP
jgi:hypothetical protein